MIRSVTRWISDSGKQDMLREIRDGQYVNLLPGARLGYDHCITIQYDDGTPEPAPNTVERRVEGAFQEWADGSGRFWPLNPSGDAVKATLIIHEPAPEPTLVEAVEDYLRDYSGASAQALKLALLREKASK